MKKIIISTIAAILVAAGLFYTIRTINAPEITHISLKDGGSAMHYIVEVGLTEPHPVQVEYTESASGKTWRTALCEPDTLHTIHLLMLKAGTDYSYKVIVNNKAFHYSTAKYELKTREQSPWLVNRWVVDERPHDASALGNGMIMMTSCKIPGSIMLMDGDGEIRWYWQVDDIGVRSAQVTPRGTILAMLRPPMVDTKEEEAQTEAEVKAGEDKQPLKKGAMGFAGGTAVAEIALDGTVLWRFDLPETQTEKQYQVLHHDLILTENNEIATLYRPIKLVDGARFGHPGAVDTLGGDGIMWLDTLGHITRTWSAWDHWDIDNDPYLERFKDDRFHINGFCFDDKGNYYISAPIEDQIWKINGETEEIEWRFGRAGDFQMDTTKYFSFEHAPHFNAEGDLMLFDNGVWDKVSGAKSFTLDEENMTATIKIDAPLPTHLFTSRMGSAYLMPNGNLLQTSSKRGAVLVTDRKGEILWYANMAFAPYRSVFVPDGTWDAWFTSKR